MLKYSCGPRMRDALGPKASAQKDVGTGRRETHGPLQQRGYKWTYLYGFVRPESGQVFWMIVPTVNTELFSLALGEFAKEVGVGKERHVLLILDKAGYLLASLTGDVILTTLPLSSRGGGGLSGWR